MKVFKEKLLFYRLMFLLILFALIFYLPETRFHYLIVLTPVRVVLVILIFIAILIDVSRAGLTKYIINDKNELIRTFMNKENFRVSISKIVSFSNLDEIGLDRFRLLFKKPKSKINLVDGSSMPVFKGLLDEKNATLLDVLKEKYRIKEK